MEYALHVVTIIMIYATLAVSLNLLVGHTNLLSIATGAFYGIGAYASAILVTKCGVSIASAVPASFALGAVLSAAISLPCARVSGDFFAITTFGFQIIMVSVLNNWHGVTSGPIGVSGIPSLWEGAGESTHRSIVDLAVAALLLVFALVLQEFLTSGAFGRVMHAIREDALVVQAFGKNPLYYKASVIALGSGLAALAGSLYAFHVRYVDPTGFGFGESILILSMVIIGGAGNNYGPVLGAGVLVLLPELMRFSGVSQQAVFPIRGMIYGSALVFLMMLRPQGLCGRYDFRD